MVASLLINIIVTLVFRRLILSFSRRATLKINRFFRNYKLLSVGKAGRPKMVRWEVDQNRKVRFIAYQTLFLNIYFYKKLATHLLTS